MTRLGTQLVHGVDIGDNDTGAVNPPIYNSSTFAFPRADAAPRWDYARSGNPTREALERQIARLERGTRGFAFASGLAALHGVLATLAPGDRVVVDRTVYGGTYSQLHDHFARWGLQVVPVAATDLGAVERAVSHGARAVLFETLTNPLLAVNDVAGISEIAHAQGALAIVDNTFLTPYLQRPLELGADIVVHSATKYLAGHSDTIAGLAVTADESLGDAIFFAQNRLGAVLAPAGSDAVRRGIQTLGVRMDRQEANARALADLLAAHPKVARVLYPGLPGHPRHALAVRQASGFGAVLSFELRPGASATAFAETLHVFRLAVSLGAVESLAEIPASMTHFELPPSERESLGISDRLVRLSAGIEDIRDLHDDVARALDAA